MQPQVRTLAYILTFTMLVGTASAHAQMPAAAGSGPVLFDNSSLLNIEITGPFGTVLDDTEQRKRQPMVLRIGDRTLKVKVRVRGNSRLRVCKFAPLRVYFGDDTAGTPFAGLKSLKLVTHCVDSERGDKNLADEYAAYRIFTVLTPNGYRTRPLRVTYRDTDGKQGGAAVTRYAFFLESRPLLAARIGTERLNVAGLRLGELQRDQAATMYVFQYLIGNTDWSLVASDNDENCCHNIDLVRREGEIYTIPYDFDLAGIVNAPYAKPDPSLHMRRVTTRRYRGYCIEREYLEAALSYVRDRRDAIEMELRQIPFAVGEGVEDMIRYLEPFFKKAEKGEKLLARFEKQCL